MTILAGDIRIMKSEVMLDTADGGGKITDNEVVDGVSNNMFPDISELDRTYGRAALRKVFPVVNTDNVDTYLGAHTILTQPPADPKVSVLLFSTQNWTDMRAAAQSRIESYLARGPYLNGQVLGTQLTGQRSVAMLFKLGRTSPDVGDTIILIQNEGLSTEFSQYVRISKKTVTKQTYTVVANGQTVSFDANQVVYEITDALRYDFSGPDPLYIDSRSVAQAQGRSTVVANAATYYGIQKITQPVTTGDITCKVSSLFSAIVPSTTSEVAILDQNAVAVASGLIRTGNVPVTNSTTTTLGPSQGLVHSGPIYPGTWSMVAGATTLVDNGRDIVNGTTKVGTIDHESGVVTFLASAPNYTGTKTTSYLPAAKLPSATQSFGTTVTTGNRGYVWTHTFYEPITRGGVTVSYRAQGKWYTLYDNAGGKLDGGDTTLGTGTLNYTTGSVAVTLGALPDVGSEVIFTSTKTGVGYSPVITAAQNVTPYVEWDISPGTTKGIARTTLSITWTNGTAKTATDDGLGNLTGDATGTVNYATGVIRMTPNSWPATGTTFNWTCTSVDLSGKVQGHTTISASGGTLTMDLGVTNIKPGSVKLLVPFNRSTIIPPLIYASGGSPTAPALNIVNNYPSVVLQSTPAPNAGYGLPTVSGGLSSDSVWIYQNDDSNGGFMYYSLPVTGWSINYTTGIVTGPAQHDVWWEGVKNGVIGIYHETGVIVANGFDLGFEVVGSPTTGTTSGSFNLTSITIPTEGLGILEGVLPSSLRISWGGSTYFESGGQWKTAHDPVTGGSTVAGSVDITSGKIATTVWPTGSSTCSVTSYAVASNRLRSTWAVFRVPGAPVTVGSLQLRVDFNDELLTVYLPELNGLGTHSETISPLGANYQQFVLDAVTVHATVDTNGNITTAHQTPAPGAILVYPAVTGTINWVTGVVKVTTTLRVAGYTTPQLSAVSGAHPDLVNADDELEFAYSVDQSAMVYNAITLKYLPLDASLLGLDPVRLPSDGKVPIFQPGMVGVLHNTQVTAFGGSAHGAPVGSGASATAVLTGDAVTGVTSLVGGSGYDQNCPLTFTGGGGTGAAGYGVQTAGAITSVVITAGGTGYTSPPTIAFVPTGTKLSLGRVRIAAVRVYDSAATPLDVNPLDYSVDLDAGTVTLLTPYDTHVSGYTTPIKVEHRIEDMALISDSEITGDIAFTRQITHDYPANTSYLSSALIIGDQQARANNVFEQSSWTSVWSDSLIGSQPTASFNKVTYPITVKNKDTIQEKWAIIFTDSNNFRVVGESVGQIATGNITTNLTPNNPNTSAPYFTLDYRGWGSGWVAGNVLRFNTVAANYPVWVIRTVQQGAPAASSDNFKMQVRGDVDA